MALELEPDWDDSTDDTAAERAHGAKEIARLVSRHSDAGYREGTVVGKTSTMQEGFNDGFARFGSESGRRLGRLRGQTTALLTWLLERDPQHQSLIEQTRALIREAGRLGIEDVVPSDPEAIPHAAQCGESLEEAMANLGGSQPKLSLQDCEDRLQALLAACNSDGS